MKKDRALQAEGTTWVKAPKRKSMAGWRQEKSSVWLEPTYKRGSGWRVVPDF